MRNLVRSSGLVIGVLALAAVPNFATQEDPPGGGGGTSPPPPVPWTLVNPSPNEWFPPPSMPPGTTGIPVLGYTGNSSAFCAVQSFDHPSGQSIGAMTGMTTGMTWMANGQFPVTGATVFLMPTSADGLFHPYSHKVDLIDASGVAQDWHYFYVGSPPP